MSGIGDSPVHVCDEALKRLPGNDRDVYRSIIGRTLALGYKAKKDRTKTPAWSFTSPKSRQTVLRVVDDGKRTHIRLKFYGAGTWSARIDKALKDTIERYQFKYTGCYGCGRCAGAPVGYAIAYDDGRNYFRCGFELIDIFDVDSVLGEEVGDLVEAQTAYWESLAEK